METTVNNKIEEKLEAFTDQIAKYTCSTCYTWEWHRLIHPGYMYAFDSERPTPCHSSTLSEYEKTIRKEYAKKDARDLSMYMRKVLERADVDYNDTFDQFKEAFELQGKALLFQIYNFIRFVKETVLFDRPCYYVHEEPGCNEFVIADRYAILRVLLSILTSKKDDIVNCPCLTQHENDEKTLTNIIDSFFVDIAEIIKLTPKSSYADDSYIIASCCDDEDYDVDEHAKVRATRYHLEKASKFKLRYTHTNITNNLDPERFYLEYLNAANNK